MDRLNRSKTLRSVEEDTLHTDEELCALVEGRLSHLRNPPETLMGVVVDVEASTYKRTIERLVSRAMTKERIKEIAGLFWAKREPNGEIDPGCSVEHCIELAVAEVQAAHARELAEARAAAFREAADTCLTSDHWRRLEEMAKEALSSRGEGEAAPSLALPPATTDSGPVLRVEFRFDDLAAVRELIEAVHEIPPEILSAQRGKHVLAALAGVDHLRETSRRD